MIGTQVWDALVDMGFACYRNNFENGAPCMWNSPQRHVRMKTLCAAFVALYLFAPLIAVPCLAYACGRWTWLVGIVFSLFCSNSFGPKIIGVFTCFSIGFWLRNGFDVHQTFTFYYFCALWGCLMWNFAEHFDQEAKGGTLDNGQEMQRHLEMNAEKIEAAMLRHLDEHPGQKLTYDDVDVIVRGVKS